MTEIDLLLTLSRGGDSCQQFKRDATHAEGMAAELAALANSGGRTAFLGVADDGSIAGLDAADVRRLNQLISNAANSRNQVRVGEMSRAGLAANLRLKDKNHFRNSYQQAAVATDLVEMTIADKPQSSNQKYRLTSLGKAHAAQGDSP
jgi:hypothetical protein